MVRNILVDLIKGSIPDRRRSIVDELKVDIPRKMKVVPIVNKIIVRNPLPNVSNVKDTIAFKGFNLEIVEPKRRANRDVRIIITHLPTSNIALPKKFKRCHTREPLTKFLIVKIQGRAMRFITDLFSTKNRCSKRKNTRTIAAQFRKFKP